LSLSHSPSFFAFALRSANHSQNVFMRVSICYGPN
jgi:hypothetical protein